jgi:hypothetical protein
VNAAPVWLVVIALGALLAIALWRPWSQGPIAPRPPRWPVRPHHTAAGTWVGAARRCRGRQGYVRDGGAGYWREDANDGA